jgi:hypothetical protein
MALSPIAKQLAQEIRTQDWSDAPYRIQGARHKREGDKVLDGKATDNVRMNVMWVAAQALVDMRDPSFDVYEFAKACDVETQRSGGGLNTAIERGLVDYSPPAG